MSVAFQSLANNSQLGSRYAATQPSVRDIPSLGALLIHRRERVAIRQRVEDKTRAC